MLTERQIEHLELLENLKKQVELLDSHKVMGLINDKQYAETIANIAHQVEELEEEYEVKPEQNLNAFNLMFKDGIDAFNKMMEGIFKE